MYFMNKRPMDLTVTEYQRLFTDFLSEGIIRTFHETHHTINKNQKNDRGNLHPNYRYM